MPTTTAPVAPTTTAQSGIACPLAPTRCPRPDITPGPVIPSDTGVCTAAYNPRGMLSAAAKRRVLAAYDFPPGTRVAEWDHLVPRWAGGTSTSKNVWPQVDVIDKQRKDRLEYGLYLDVCRDRHVSLADARERMRVFWMWW